METTNYVEKHLPPEIVQKLEAGAFQSVCNHLRERSDDVQNLDIMTVSGFCRNCLAKVCRLNGIYMYERDSYELNRCYYDFSGWFWRDESCPTR